MLPEAHADIERLLWDGAWFPRITHTLLARDDSDVGAHPIADGPKHPRGAVLQVSHGRQADPIPG